MNIKNIKNKLLRKSESQALFQFRRDLAQLHSSPLTMLCAKLSHFYLLHL